MNTIVNLHTTLISVTAFSRLSALTLVLSVGLANAASLTLTPSTTTLTAGADVSVVLGISGLEATTLGAYDVTLAYAPSVWTFNGGTFGNGLGSTLFDTLSLDSSNFLNVAQLSLESPASLTASQPDAFTLATLNFTVSNSITGLAGTSMILNNIVLSDENGDPLTVAGETSVTFLADGTAPPAAVPLPSAIWLFAASLGLVEGMRKRFVNKSAG